MTETETAMTTTDERHVEVSVASTPSAAYFLTILAAFLVVFAIPVAANVVVNPRAEFPTNYYPLLAEDIAEEKIEVFAKLPEPPAIIVLGSSHARSFTAKTAGPFGNSSFFNWHMDGSGPPEHEALLRYSVAQRVPAEVILVLDQDRLHGFENDRYQRSARFHILIEGQPRPALYVAAAIQSFHIDYLNDTWTSIEREHFGAPRPRDSFSFAADGSRNRPVPARDPAFFSSETELSRLLPRYDASEGMSERATSALREIAEFAAEESFKLRIVLPPLHPETLRTLTETPSAAAAFENARSFALTLCAENVRVYDYLRVETFGGDPSNFSNGDHFAEATATKIVRGLANETGQICP